MRFKVTPLKEPKHIVSCVGWASPEEVYSVGDDQQVLSWHLGTTDPPNVVLGLSNNVYATDMDWCPRPLVSGKKQIGSDIFALAAADGKIHFISKNGRIEKTVDAHQGAVLTARWSHDGSALATGGEDGLIKIWSKSGMLRSTLATTSKPVYSVAWSLDSSSLLYTNGKNLVLKPLQPSSKPSQWLAHDGLILKIAWNANNNLIISGGEDCRYKMWDCYGRQLYISPVQDHPITSLSWTPDGELFAVGSFNVLYLCDKVGWSHCLEKPDTGSIFNLSWSSDGTKLAGACGNGHVLLAHIIERRLEWKNFEVEITGRKLILVRNVLDDAFEKLEMQNRVLKVSLSHQHLIVISTSQCLIYSVKNWNTPAIFDLKEGGVSCIIQAEKHFLLVEGNYVTLYTYEGKVVCNPRWPGMRPDVLNPLTASLSNHTLAIRDQTDEKVVHLFDAITGKMAGDGKPLAHEHEISMIALNQSGSASEQHLAFINRNGDLYLSAIRMARGLAKKTVKLAVMAQSVCWNDAANILVALLESKLTVFYYPPAVFVDRNLLFKAVSEKDASDFGKNPQLVGYLGNQVDVRRADGSMVATAISPFPSVLHDYVKSSRWDDAIRLCRIVEDEALWACLAAMATHAKQMYAAEVSYAALNEADKVEFLQQISDITVKEIQLAEMALMSGNAHEAEAILLQGGFIFRAIMLNINLCKWDRALELSLKHKIHIDTVLAYRQRYLVRMEMTETKPKFLDCAKQIEWEWETVNNKIQEEYKKEHS